MPSYDDVMTALRNADAAGDADAARRLAGIAAKLRDEPQAAPAPPPGPVTRATQAAVQIPTAPPGGAPQVGPPAAQPAPQPGAPAPTFGQQAVGAAEAGASLVTGGTTGMVGGILATIDNAVKRAGAALTGTPLELPTTEQAFQRGMEAGTYSPRTPAGQEQAGAVGQALATHGPAIVGLGPELAAVGKAMGAAKPFVRPAVATAAEAAVPTISPERAKTAAAGMEQGVTPAPHQLASNKFVKMAGETAEHIPFTFGEMRRGERQAAFNKALIKQINPEDTTSERLTSDVFSKAMDRSGGKIGELTAKTEIPAEDVTPGFRSVRRQLERATDDDRRVIGGYLDEFERLAAENDGKIPGTAFKNLNSELGADIRANAGNKTARLLGDVQDVVLDAFRDRLSPEDQTAYDAARGEYAKAKTILPLVAKHGAEGNIPPSALEGAVNATKSGKNAMARGRAGELGDLARAGKYLVDQKSSGTAERSLVYSMIFDPIAGLAKAASVGPAAAAYNLAGPAITRAMVRKGLRRAGPGTIAEGAAEEGGPLAGGPGPAGAPPEGGPPAGPTGPAAVDPRLAEIARLRENAPEAVQAALDEHEKTVRKTIATEAAARKRAADLKDLEAAAQQTQDPDLRKTLQAKADALRAEKIPVGQATELAGTPTPPVPKVGKIPVGKATEGQPALPVEKPTPVPAGEATEITPEVVEPPEPIPTGEATEITPVSNRPAGEVVSNVPKAEPISNRPRGEPAPVSNIPKAEPNAQTPDYTHGALFKAAELAGIETRGRRPSEVRAAFEASWRKDHGLSEFDAERAKAVAKALDIDEKAVENAAVQHERSPRMFDRAIDKIIEKGAQSAPETKQATGGSEGTAPNAGAARAPGEAGAPVGRGGNAEGNPKRAGGEQNPAGEQSPAHAGRSGGGTEAAGERAGPNGPATGRANAEGNQPAGSREKGRVIALDKRGDKYTLTVKREEFGAGPDKAKSVLVEARDPETGERRGFVDFAVRPDGVLTAENAKVAPDFKKRGIAEMMYKAARDEGHDIAPGRVQTDEGHAMVESFRKKGLINKEAEGQRFRAGDLELAPIEGETIPGEKATRAAPRGFEKGARKPVAPPKLDDAELFRRLDSLNKRSNRAGYEPLTEQEFADLKGTGYVRGTKLSTGKLTGEGHTKRIELDREITSRANAIADAEDQIQDGQPFKASAVDVHGLKAPEDYVRDGSMYRKADIAHKDPGQPPEPVTPRVVAQATAKNVKPAEARAALLKDIDAAIAKAPKRDASIGTTEPRTTQGTREFSGSRGDMRVQVREGSNGNWHVADYSLPYGERGKNAAIIQASTPTLARRVVETMLSRASTNDKGNLVFGESDFVTFKVPGDGEFKVLNDPDRLAEFRAKVEKSPGFSNTGQRTQTAPTLEGTARQGSGGPAASVANMVDEGDYQAAHEYMQFKGLKVDDLKLGDKPKARLLAWIKDNEERMD